MENFIRPAEVHWRHGVPFSPDFQDIYFSSDNGVEESRHVFLSQNGLPDRWRQEGAPAHSFTIAETGFGTGLNFFLTLKAWIETQDKTSDHLDYVTSEKHPFRSVDFIAVAETLFTRWPTLRPTETTLFDEYPDLISGFHTISLAEARVTLMLLFGDNAEMYSQLVLPEGAGVDAWYLDGFAPARNPAMWSDDFFASMRRLSKASSTFSTFSAASQVRKGLEQVGFTVNKIAGFGRKREMLKGSLAQSTKPASRAPWYSLPAPAADKGVVVIGAGLAGTAVARQLAKQGNLVTLLERHPEPALGASSNRAGVIYPPVSQQASAEYQYYAQAYQLMTKYLQQEIVPWQACGVLQLTQDVTQQSRYQAFASACHDPQVVRWVENEEASELAGIELCGAGLWFAQGGAIDPVELCAHYLATPSIECQFNTDVVSLQSTDGGWQLTVIDKTTGQQRELFGQQVVIATARDLHALLPGYEEFVWSNRGQVSYLPETAGLADLKCVLCEKGYATPLMKGVNVIGATKDDSSELGIRSDDHAENLDQLNALLGSKDTFTVDPATLSGNAGFRTVTRDHLPLVGPAPDMAFYQEHYHDLQHGRPAENYPAAGYLSGLYLSVAHGARGISSSLLAANMIGAMMAGKPLPVTRQVYQGVHPARFLIRALKRG